MVASAVHAAAELLPVSSSGHLRALGGEAGADVAEHLVPLGVTLVAWRRDVAEVLRRLDGRRVAMHAAAGALPSVVGVLVGDRRERLSLPAGLLAGAALLAASGLADGTRSRWDAGVADGVWLGLAQTAALWPGVSRLGTTLAVARLRGFAPDEAPLLAREVGVPITLGALLWQIRRRTATGWPRSVAHSAVDLDHPQRSGRRGRRAAGRADAAAALTGAVAALPLARAVDRGAPLWPFAAERALLALLVLRQSPRDE